MVSNGLFVRVHDVHVLADGPIKSLAELKGPGDCHQRPEVRRPAVIESRAVMNIEPNNHAAARAQDIELRCLTCDNKVREVSEAWPVQPEYLQKNRQTLGGFSAR